MSNKIFYVTLSVMLLSLCGSVAAQPKKVPRIGYLSPSGDPYTPGTHVEAFRQGLRDLGYIEGKSILVEYRYQEGKTGPSR